MGRWAQARRDARELEARRIHAYTMLQAGQGLSEVARAVGVTRQAVFGWLRRAETIGPDGLRARPRPGRPPRSRGSAGGAA